MTGDPAITPEDDLTVAEYVLGVLPHGERTALARRLAAEPALAARAEAWEARLAPLGEAMAPVEAPRSVLAGVERRLFPADSPAGLWHSLAFWRGVAVALLCALIVGAGLALFALRQQAAPGATYVAELSGPQAALRLVALYDGRTGLLKLNRVAGAAATGRDFELWLVRDKTPPVSLGVLPRQSVAEVRLPAATAPLLGAGGVLAVSDEPAGGSPTGQPTGAVLATGALAPI